MKCSEQGLRCNYYCIVIYNFFVLLSLYAMSKLGLVIFILNDFIRKYVTLRMQALTLIERYI
jgi:hypothetical protein